MKRLVLLLLVIPGIISACGLQSAPAPTPLPTAVPPSGTQIEGGDWAVSFAHEFPEQLWASGVHRYKFQLNCPGILEDSDADWVYFDVLEEADVLPFPVYFRLHGLSTDVLAGQNVEALHPDQATIAVVTLVGLSEENTSYAIDNCICLFHWDADLFQLLTPGEPFIP